MSSYIDVELKGETEDGETISVYIQGDTGHPDVVLEIGETAVYLNGLEMFHSLKWLEMLDDRRPTCSGC